MRPRCGLLRDADPTQWRAEPLCRRPLDDGSRPDASAIVIDFD